MFIVLYVPLENFINMEDFTKSQGNEGFELVLWSVLLSFLELAYNTNIGTRGLHF